MTVGKSTLRTAAARALPAGSLAQKVANCAFAVHDVVEAAETVATVVSDVTYFWDMLDGSNQYCVPFVRKAGPVPNPGALGPAAQPAPESPVYEHFLSLDEVTLAILIHQCDRVAQELEIDRNRGKRLPRGELALRQILFPRRFMQSEVSPDGAKGELEYQSDGGLVRMFYELERQEKRIDADYTLCFISAETGKESYVSPGRLALTPDGIA